MVRKKKTILAAKFAAAAAATASLCPLKHYLNRLLNKLAGPYHRAEIERKKETQDVLSCMETKVQL